MQAVNDAIETIHLYVIREEKKPFVVLPLFGACLCLAAIICISLYSALHPSYEQETLTIPAHFLPQQTFQAAIPIIPTGLKTYPATTAHGTLTLANGSVITEQLPQRMIFSGQGIEVITDEAVLVPAGNAAGLGVATVSAHAVKSGNQGNISPLTIDQVYGTSLYIRNLYPFTGGKDSYSVKVVTRQDKQTALDAARALLTAQKARMQAILANPCHESISGAVKLAVQWRCQFVSSPKLPGMQITATRLVGKSLLVDVLFLPRPQRMIVK